MADLRIEPLQPEQAADTSRMLARAFTTNPLHVAAFGPAALTRNEAFFKGGLATFKGTKLVATSGTQIAGFIHWVSAPACQLSEFEKITILPTLVSGVGLGSAIKLGRWLTAWSKHDPAGGHVHLGPVGVSPDAQGTGVGRRLMERYCAELDRTGGTGYLETDRPENIAFYRRFGFDTVDEAPVLGVPNFFMRRPAGP
jgi:ribosomal protein S18 acetylase RimI-like enzyme